MRLEITDWAIHFENNKTRPLKALRWIPLPVKHDGEGYTDLIESDRGAEKFAAFVLMAEVAAKCVKRGVLAKIDGSPITTRTLAIKTRAPEEIFIIAIPELLKIGWLRDLDPIDQESDGIRQASDGIRRGGALEGRERREGKEGKGKKENPLVDFEKKSPVKVSKKNPPKIANYPDWFSQLYDLYPKKSGKAAAFRKAQKLVDAGHEKADLEKAVTNYQHDERVLRGFPMDLSRFLGPDKVWEDYVEGCPTNTEGASPVEADRKSKNDELTEANKGYEDRARAQQQEFYRLSREAADSFGSGKPKVER